MTGQTVSHYKILEKLGEGGMGVVYKAEDTKLKRIVALKFLPQRLTATGEEQSRFVQEAQAAAALNHPNVCAIHAIEEVDEQQFIVMEFIEGKSLKALAKKEQLSFERVSELSLQIAEGLKVAHEKGIVHRDIKSENIMAANDGRIRIMDFGLAKLGRDVGLTKTGTTVGTISYMSPEQIQGLEVDRRADLWSFGVVLYEMLTGQLPFQGMHEAAAMYEILNVEPKAIATLRADVPEHFQILVSRLLQKDPSKRMSSASEIIEQLKKPSAPAQTTSVEKSIAVLYFENMSSEKESEYFCAGMTEDLITDLSKISGLKVVSRNDVLPFRNKECNTRSVGETLRVSYIVEGSVRKAGSKIRITAQLIDVRTGFHVWADRFDRLIEDIFDVQTEVSQKIAEALKISLTDSEKKSLAKKPTDDLRAYDFYMRGREFLHRRGKKNNEAAIQMFENAISLDSNFAAAYAALAEACSYMYSWYDGEKKWLKKTIEASQKALSIDPQSVEAQFNIGVVYVIQKRYAEAQQTLDKVVQQKPDYYDAYRWLGIGSDIMGEYDAALRYYEQCAKLKPYSEEPWMHIYMTDMRKGNKDEADLARRKMVEVGERKLAVNPEDVITLSRIAGLYGHFGEKEKALATLKKVLELDPNDGLAQYNSACSYAVLGNKKEALVCLRNAIANGYKNVGDWVKSDPELWSLRDDPEFKALLSEIG